MYKQQMFSISASCLRCLLIDSNKQRASLVTRPLFVVGYPTYIKCPLGHNLQLEQQVFAGQKTNLPAPPVPPPHFATLRQNPVEWQR